MAREKEKSAKGERSVKIEKNAERAAGEASSGAGENEKVSGVKQQILKKFGEGSVFTQSDSGGDGSIAVEAMPTGIMSLDSALGTGGLPKGRIVEIYGPESSGKTTLTLNFIAKCQQSGGVAAFIDAEHALDVAFAKKIGVDVGNLLISQPGCGEECFDICAEMIRSGVVNMVVIDSVAAMVPRAEIESNAGEIQVGLMARLMASGLRKIMALASATGCTVIFINQLRDKIGVTYGSSETTPGGRALKFFSSVRLDIRKTEVIKNGDSPIGIRTRVKVTKNKCSMPFKVAELELLFNEGISYEGDLIDMAMSHGIIEKSGAWYSIGAERIGQGRESARSFLKGNSSLCVDIETRLRDIILKGAAYAAAQAAPKAM